MNEKTVKKYIKNLDDLLKEIQDYREDLFESEAMVIFCFGIIYKHTNLQGLVIKDEKNHRCDAVAFLESNAEKPLVVEFELRSKNFVKHGHDKERCDLIVCWKHNWKEIPENIDVIELDDLWKKAGFK